MLKNDMVSGIKNNTIVVPLNIIGANHLEFAVSEEDDGTFTVTDYTAGALVPNVRYTGFPSREEAERFVLVQPACWDDE